MPLPMQTKEERFSIAFCRALAACSGVNYSTEDCDFGLDGSFCSVSRRKDGRFFSDGVRIDFQAKSTKNIEISGDDLIYDLEVKNYRDLIVTDTFSPRILVLYLLPEHEDQWMIFNERDVIVQHGAYWCSLRGHEDTLNTSTIRIRVPLAQKLTTFELARLLHIVRGGNLL